MRWLTRTQQACWVMITTRYPQTQNKYQLAAGMARHALRPGDRVLDAGCGHTSMDLDGCAVSLVGFDRVHADVKQNRALQLGAVADMEQVPFKAATFDLILCQMVAEHLQHPVQVFREFSRVLKPGGSLLIMTPSCWNIVTLISRAVPNRWHPGLMHALFGIAESDTFPTYYRANSMGQLQRHAAQAHLKEVEHVYFQPPPYAFTFSRGVCRLMIAYYHLLNRWTWLGPWRGVILARYAKER